MFVDESLRSLLDHLRINSSTDVGSMIVSEAGQGHVDKLKELLTAHPDKVTCAKVLVKKCIYIYTFSFHKFDKFCSVAFAKTNDTFLVHPNQNDFKLVLVYWPAL